MDKSGLCSKGRAVFEQWGLIRYDRQAMKVILTKDVARVGRKYDVKDVPDGHAINFLIPRKLAERATPDVIARVEKMRASAEAGKAESEAKFKEMIANLGDAGVVLKAEANEQGGLFRAIHASDVLDALTKRGFRVSEEQIIIEEPIKTIGAHTIKLSSGGTESDCKVTVEHI